MRKRVWKIGLIVALLGYVAVVPTIIQAQEEPKKKTLIIIPFSDASGNKLGDLATNMVGKMIGKLMIFDLKGKASTQSTGILDDNTASSFGEQNNIDLLLMGTVSKAEFQESRGQTCQAVTPKGAVNYSCNRLTRKAALQIVVFDVQKKKIIYKTEASVGFSPGDQVFMMDYQAGTPRPAPNQIFQDPIDACCDKLFMSLQHRFPVMGKVVKKDGQLITVDVGKNWGIKRGRGVLIYKAGTPPITDPDSGEITGYQESGLKVKDKVSKSYEKACDVKLSKKDIELVEEGDIVVFKPQTVGLLF